MPSLASLFLFLAVVGGGIGVLQALGALIGMGEDHSPEGHGVDAVHHLPGAHGATSPLDVFNFRSVRAIAAGIGFAGLGGMLALREFGDAVAVALALLLGLAVYLFVAFVMRGFARLEADHSIHPLRAIGLEATVSLPIPVRGAGPGKVTLVVAGRRVEWPAIQSDGELAAAAIPAGAPVHVIDAADDTTLTVVPLPHRS